MTTSNVWVESKAKESLAQNFVKTVLELSGYQVMNYGIENHNQEVIKKIKENYRPDTNRRLLSMPDLVVVDNETKESWLIEVKFRHFEQYFDFESSNLLFHYGHLKSYLDFWKDATLVLVLDVEPYCVCVDLNRVNWNVHFKTKIKNKEDSNREDESWNFCGLYTPLKEKFHKVTSENFEKAITLSGLG